MNADIIFTETNGVGTDSEDFLHERPPWPMFR